MLRPSATMARMAGTPSAVAGIFTYRLGWADELVEVAGRLDGAGGVVGQAGATSSDT